MNYIYIGSKLIAKDGFIPQNAGKQHYRPFGESIEGEIDDVGYTGHKFDQDTGLSYMQARYYDPVIGRFYSNDPVDAATFTQNGNVHGFNRYAYANNNPYKYIDPDGTTPLAGAAAGCAVTGPGCPLGAVAGGVIGATIGAAAFLIYNESADSDGDSSAAKPDAEPGKEPDPADKRGELSRAGRALQKHGSRPGSAFPTATGNAESKNNIKVTISSDLDYENLIAEIIADGEFIGLLTAEPNQQVCFELPEGQGNWNKIEANLLIEALQIARKELLQD